jgi:hypothetical protein
MHGLFGSSFAHIGLFTRAANLRYVIGRAHALHIQPCLVKSAQTIRLHQ